MYDWVMTRGVLTSGLQVTRTLDDRDEKWHDPGVYHRCLLTI